MRALIWAIILACVAYIAYPIWTVFRLESAIADRDIAVLNALVDWPQLRAGLKSDIRRELMVATANDPSAAGGGFGTVLGMGVGVAVVDIIVDGFASPGAMYRLAEKDPQNFKGRRLRDMVTGARLISPTYIEISFHAPERSIQTGFSAALTLQGASWRITSITMPWAELQKAGDAMLKDMGASLPPALARPNRQ